MKRFISAWRRHAPCGVLALALLAFAASAEAVHTCTVGIGNLSLGRTRERRPPRPQR